MIGLWGKTADFSKQAVHDEMTVPGSGRTVRNFFIIWPTKIPRPDSIEALRYE